MQNPFKRKRCKQCGWELGVFSRQSFCSDTCVSTWDRNKREYKELQRKNIREEEFWHIERENKK